MLLYHHENNPRGLEGKKMTDISVRSHIDPQTPPESLARIYRMLDDMATWPKGWNSYNALPPSSLALIAARKWITQFYEFGPTLASCPTTWIQPNVTANAHGDVLFSWSRGRKDLEIMVEDDMIFYLKAWGPNVSTEMQDGEITTIEDAARVWTWLLA